MFGKNLDKYEEQRSLIIDDKKDWTPLHTSVVFLLAKIGVPRFKIKTLSHNLMLMRPTTTHTVLGPHTWSLPIVSTQMHYVELERRDVES